MLLLILWSGLLIMSEIWGLALMGWISPGIYDHVPRYLLLSVWVGLLSYAVILLGLSLLWPLSLPLGITVAIAGSCASLALPHTRVSLYQSYHPLSWWHGLGCLGLGGLASLYAHRTMVSLTPSVYDLGLYHFGLIQWLADYGSVPGLGLIHQRFAFTSAWFSLAAIFNHGALEGRVYSFLGGLGLWLFLLQFSLTLFKLKRGVPETSAERMDWFNLSFLVLVLPAILRWEMPVTATPDFPVILLTLLIVQVGNLLIARRKSLPQEPMPTGILVFLAAGTVALKLSAFPLLIAALALQGYLGSWQWKKMQLLKVGMLALVPLLIWFMVNLITSGCIAFPALPVCLPVSWGLTAKDAATMTQAIREWAQWSGARPDNGDFWLIHWLGYEGEAAFLTLWTMVAVLMGFRLGYGRQQQPLWIASVALVGMTFVLISAPTLRFGLGYFVLVPSLMTAELCCRRSPLAGFSVIILAWLAMDLWMGISQWRWAFILVVLAMNGLVWWLKLPGTSKGVLVLGISFFAIYTVNLLTETVYLAPYVDLDQQQGGDRWWRPTPLPVVPLVQHQTETFSYVKPAQGDTCWNAPLPCTPNLSRNTVELRDTNIGFKTGFQVIKKAPEGAENF